MPHLFKTVVVVALLASPALAQDRGKWFKSLRTPKGGSCCDLSDCAPTHAWEYRDGHWWAEVRGQMVQIPPGRVLSREPFPWDPEQAVVCARPSDRYIYCFIPPAIGN